MATQTQTQTQSRPNGVVTAQAPNASSSSSSTTTTATTTTTTNITSSNDGAAQPSQTEQSVQEWDEAAHIEALRVLISLQEKIIDMRVAIPNLIQPLARASRTTHPTPAALERVVAERATAMVDEMAALRSALEDSDAQRVLARARERGDGTAGDEGWEVVVGRPRWIGAEGVDGLWDGQGDDGFKID